MKPIWRRSLPLRIVQGRFTPIPQPDGTWYSSSGGLVEGTTFTLTATTTDTSGNVTTKTITLTYSTHPFVVDVVPTNNAWLTTAAPVIIANFIVPGGVLAGGTMTIDGNAVDTTVSGNSLLGYNFVLADSATHTAAVVGWNAGHVLDRKFLLGHLVPILSHR